MSESDDDLRREIERLKEENESLKKGKELRLQVSAKGGVSLYGIRRFPITFYKEEWETLLGMGDEIRAYLAEHEGELKTRG